MSQEYQTRRLNTEEGNLFGPIRTRRNSHTHTSNTRQSEPQLKDSSCLSVIPSHNSWDAILSHNSRNATCLTPIPSHNSRNTPTSLSLRYHQSLVNHTHQKQTTTLPLHYCLALLCSRQKDLSSRLFGRASLPPSAKHLCTHCLCRYRLAGRPLLLGATTRSKIPLFL